MKERRGAATEVARDLPPVADSIAEARAILAELTAGLPQSVRDDAALLVSELMSNAVRHGGTSARLTVSLRAGALTVAVHDNGDGAPTMRDGALDPAAPSGRGLRIVDSVADRWGVDPDQDADSEGKTVWFRLTTGVAEQTTEKREHREAWS